MRRVLLWVSVSGSDLLHVFYQHWYLSTWGRRYYFYQR
jgi:hypothetical protein